MPVFNLEWLEARKNLLKDHPYVEDHLEGLEAIFRAILVDRNEFIQRLQTELRELKEKQE